MPPREPSTRHVLDCRGHTPLPDGDAQMPRCISPPGIRARPPHPSETHNRPPSPCHCAPASLCPSILLRSVPYSGPLKKLSVPIDPTGDRGWAIDTSGGATSPESPKSTPNGDGGIHHSPDYPDQASNYGEGFPKVCSDSCCLCNGNVVKPI